MPSVSDEKINSLLVFRLLFAGQPDHPFRQIDARDLRRSFLPQHPGVEAFATGHIHDGLPGWIADQGQQAERLDMRAPRLLLGPFVLFSDGIVVVVMESVAVRRLQNVVGLTLASGQPDRCPSLCRPSACRPWQLSYDTARWAAIQETRPAAR